MGRPIWNGARDRFATLPANIRGAAWMLLAAVGFSFMAAIVKLLGQRFDSMQITFFRNALGLVWLLPFLLRDGVGLLRTRYWGRHLTRAFMGTSAMYTGFYAITHLPLATVTSISFAIPLFTIALGVLVLRERVLLHRWVATIVGFGGVLVMVRPGAMPLDLATLAALANAMFVACAQAMVKTMPSSEKPLTMLIIFALCATAFTMPLAVSVWRWPDTIGWLLALAVGGVGIFSQGCIIRAFQSGDATAVSPFDYSRLIFATILGYVLFAEVPDTWTLVGAAIVIASTLSIVRREARGTAVRPDPAERS